MPSNPPASHVPKLFGGHVATLVSSEQHDLGSGTHQALQAVKKVKMEVLSFQPLGSLQLESQDPNLLNYLLSPHSVPARTQETQKLHMPEISACSTTPNITK